MLIPVQESLTMHKTAFVAVFLCFISGCQGLELTMDRDVVVTGSGRTTCGIVLCVEQSLTAGDNATSSPFQGEPSSLFHPAAVDTVTDLAIFKAPQGAATSSGTDRGARRLLAHVTAQNPRASRVSDGVKVDGSLEAGRATLTVELVKQDDCHQAEFTCEVRALDTQGRELVRSARLLQQPPVESPPETGGHAGGGGGSWSPALAMHLVDLVQRLHTDLALTKSAVDSWEDKLDAKMAVLEADVKTSVGDDIKAFQNRFEDRITSLQNRLEDKMENEVASLKPARGNADGTRLDPPAKSIMTSNCAALIEEAINSNLSFVNGQLQNIETAVSNRSLSLLHRMGDGFSQLEGRLDTGFEALSSHVNSSAAETRSHLDNTLSGLGGVTASEVESVMTDLLTPKTCRRGVVAVLTQPAFPYHVIKPSGGETPLDVPYLCDTFTDGGGWIIIQRRTSGVVDFYRNWAEYKKGFGALDTGFWLGNERLHALTSRAEFELRVELRYRGKSAFAHYGTFAVADEAKNYALSVGPFSGGTAGDALTDHNGKGFTTFDRDNDAYGAGNCAVAHTGAWWYHSCHSSNLNGVWGAAVNHGPTWARFTDVNPASYTEMKIRRVDNQ